MTVYYCLVDISTNKIQSWTSEELRSSDEENRVYELSEEDSAKLDKMSPRDIPYFDGTTLWIEKAPRTNEEINQDVEDLILLLAETLGTESSDE